MDSNPDVKPGRVSFEQQQREVPTSCSGLTRESQCLERGAVVMTLPSVFLVLSLGISQVDNTPVVVPKSSDYEEQNPFDLNFDKE